MTNKKTDKNNLCRRDEFKSGGQSKAPEFFFVVPLHLFGSTSTISRLGDRYIDGQILFSFLFAVFLLSVPPVPSHLYKCDGTYLLRAL